MNEQDSSSERPAIRHERRLEPAGDGALVEALSRSEPGQRVHLVAATWAQVDLTRERLWRLGLCDRVSVHHISGLVEKRRAG